MDQEQTIEEIIASLSNMQKMFCEYYVGKVDFNGAEAARRAGYSEKGAKEQASLILTYTNVKAYIDHLKAERSKKVLVSADDILRQLNTFRSASIDDYVEIVEDTYTKGNKEIKYKFNR